MADNRQITIQMSVEEMGRISIALDVFCFDREDYRSTDPEYTRLQAKWDQLYKDVHGAISKGVVHIDTQVYK